RGADGSRRRPSPSGCSSLPLASVTTRERQHLHTPSPVPATPERRALQHSTCPAPPRSRSTRSPSRFVHDASTPGSPPAAARQQATSATGSTSTPGSLPVRTSAGGTALKRSGSSSASTGASNPGGASATAARQLRAERWPRPRRGRSDPPGAEPARPAKKQSSTAAASCQAPPVRNYAAQEGASRVAVVADVHGNATAMEAIAVEIAAERPDAIVFLGDLTWGPLP